MSALPESFLEEIRAILQDEKEVSQFEESFGRGRAYGLRYNPLKCDKDTFLAEMPFALKEVPWAKTGFYYEEADTPGKHPYHEAGAYYIQEPSAMSVADHLEVMPGDVVCDLCAAPGGKSTQLATMMQGEGLIVSNEIIPSRAKILSQNVERMGVGNCVVTNEPPERMSQIFPAFFDKILVDAPCSGEGMFRKNDEALAQWSVDNVKLCAERQQFILEHAAMMLKPGGIMVYSTCTFNRMEDEDTIKSFLDTHPEFDVVPLSFCEGQSEGLIAGTIRLWPHKLSGEGHFVCKLKKADGPVSSRGKISSDKVKKEMLSAYEAFAEQFFVHKPTGVYQAFGDKLCIVPAEVPRLAGVKVVRAGLCLGEYKKNRFEPDHALALAMTKEDVKNYIIIKDGAKFIRGESLSVADDVIYRNGEKDGWCVVFVGSFSVGIGKIVGNSVKNHYPKGLRIG